MLSQFGASRKIKQSKLQHSTGDRTTLTESEVGAGDRMRDDDNNPPHQAPLNRLLPKELVLKIFSFLDLVSLCRCARVCKYWNGLAHDGSIWQDVDLFEFQRDVQSPVIENIAKRCGLFLKRLNLRGCQHLSDEALKSFAFHCKNIEVLVLQECRRITDDTFRALAKHCPRLKRLNIDSLTLVTDDGIKVLADGCKLLEEVNMSWCEQITQDGIRYLAQHALHLRTFIAKGCANLHDEALQAIADNCPELKVLNVSNCSAVTDVGIGLVAKQCPELEYLSLANCIRVSDEALIAVAHGCPKLKYLELPGCTQLSDLGLVALTKACHDLHCLDLEECLHITDTTLLHIAQHCPRLEKLCLSHCELVSDEGILHLAHSPAASSGALKVLELDNCPLMTDSALEALMECPSLQRIDLYDCQQITRGAIRRLKSSLRHAHIHAYFAPVTPPPAAAHPRQRICRCCSIL